jgi:LemA protein
MPLGSRDPGNQVSARARRFTWTGARGPDSDKGRGRALGLALVGVTAALLAGCGYGQIQELEEQVRSARQEIEIQLQRRAELVPNLLQILQGYDAVGSELAGSVANARADLVAAIQSGDLERIQSANAQLCSGLQRVVESADGDTALRSEPAFELLRSQLVATEQEVERASRDYNDAVLRFNEFIREFPQLVTARVIGAGKLEPFEPSGASVKGTPSLE